MPGNDDLETALRTPTQGNMVGLAGGYDRYDDRDVTLIPRGRDDDGDGESSYGYGRIGGGLDGGGDAMSSMTEDIRQALTRSRFEPGVGAGNGTGQRSRASSSASSRYTSGSATPSRASSKSRPTTANASPRVGSGAIATTGDLGISLEQLSMRDKPRSSAEIRRDASIEDMHRDPPSPTVDPSSLVVLRRLGEGSGGAVELVKDPKTGRTMAKKVSKLGVINPYVPKRLNKWYRLNPSR